MPKLFETAAKCISNKDNYAIDQIDKDIYDQLNLLVVQVKENLKSQSKLNENSKFYYPFWKHGTEISLGELDDLVYSPKYYIKFYGESDKTKNTDVNIKFNVSFYESKTSMGLRAKLL